MSSSFNICKIHKNTKQNTQIKQLLKPVGTRSHISSRQFTERGIISVFCYLNSRFISHQQSSVHPLSFQDSRFQSGTGFKLQASDLVPLSRGEHSRVPKFLENFFKKRVFQQFFFISGSDLEKYLKVQYGE